MCTDLEAAWREPLQAFIGLSLFSLSSLLVLLLGREGVSRVHYCCFFLTAMRTMAKNTRISTVIVWNLPVPITYHHESKHKDRPVCELRDSYRLLLYKRNCTREAKGTKEKL